MIGEPIGVYDVEGYDSYTDKKHQMQAEVFENSGISAEHIIAVKLGNEYYTFTYGEYNPPATLGEVLDEYNLANVLEFNRFRTYSGSTENGYFQIDDDAYIWDVLSNCRDATFIQDDTWNGSERDYISFTATSDALGVYKRVFYVSSDGYVRTNILIMHIRSKSEKKQQVKLFPMQLKMESKLQTNHTPTLLQER